MVHPFFMQKIVVEVKNRFRFFFAENAQNRNLTVIIYAMTAVRIENQFECQNTFQLRQE